jgi:uncharacterized protein YjbJ (UPF0337 family)
MGQSTEELSGDIATTRQSLASDLDALQDRVSPAAIVERRKSAAKARVGSLRDRVMGTAHDLRDTTTGGASSAGGSVQDTMGSARDAASSAASTAQDRYQGAPLAAGLVAFGAGMVIAAMLPASEREAVAAGKVVDAAKENAQPAMDAAKGQAQQMAQQVGETASDAAPQVKAAAGDSASRVTSEGRSSAESVRNDASST